jgi:microcystin-dependent protein
MSNSFIGEVRAFPYTFAPDGWLDCMGQLVAIQQYQALFAVIGFSYGGDRQTTFGLPDLRGRAALGQGQGIGLTNAPVGQLRGSDTVALVSQQQLPAHNHTITSRYLAPGVAPGAIGSAPNNAAYLSRMLSTSVSPPVTQKAYTSTAQPTTAMGSAALSVFPPGGTSAQAHENRQPFTTIRYCICATDGVYPPRP